MIFHQKLQIHHFQAILQINDLGILTKVAQA